MTKYFVWMLFCLSGPACMHAQPVSDFNDYLKTSRQVLFMKTSSITAIQGTLFLYDRTTAKESWKLVDSFAVTIGRAGLAKDALTQIPFSDSMPVKHEGDGKSPAGIFSLEFVFSYHDLKNLRMPFVKVDTNFLCVDDFNSDYYNTLIVSDSAKHNYSSFEYMKRSDSLYEFGVWVLYNSTPVVQGNGSCIFIHVWRNETAATSGCTAMSRENILKLIYWLDKKKNPVLVQTAGSR